jgi:glycolate oxidase
VNKQAILKSLSVFLPEDSILFRDEELIPYECDGLTAYRRKPMLVVLPHNVEQVQQVIRFCREHKITVVARGAGTGLSGGALPDESGILLSLARFNRILEIDTLGRRARVQPGVTNLAISAASRPMGFYYAPDPSSQIACTIGGNVAENSGGVHCLKYGLTVHNVLRVQMVTIDGDIVTVGSEALDSAGYDLLALMHGSEGMLGIITEISVRLLPVPETARVVMAAFADVAAAGRAVGNIIAEGIVPAGLEMMDRLSTKAAEDFVHAGYPLDAEAILLCESDGSAEEVATEIAIVEKVLKQAGASRVQVSNSEQERQLFWKGRKSAFPAVGRISPDYYCMDGTIPRSRLPEVLEKTLELSEHYGLRVANVFHAGDGNLHPLILYDANQPGELEKAEQFGADILELCVNVGGTITGEHGVGIEKIDSMCVQFAAEELTQFHAVKAAFDPLGLLNPGKAVPTLHRCAELGAMHVHHGKLPFPELERF